MYTVNRQSCQHYKVFSSLEHACLVYCINNSSGRWMTVRKSGGALAAGFDPVG